MPVHKSDMSPLKQIAVLVAVVIIGPAMYAFSRVHSLTMAFARVHIGDTPVQVMSVMGKPQNSSALETGEYRYWSWPLPQVWVVHFGNGKVVAKEGAVP